MASLCHRGWLLAWISAAGAGIRILAKIAYDGSRYNSLVRRPARVVLLYDVLGNPGAAFNRIDSHGHLMSRWHLLLAPLMMACHVAQNASAGSGDLQRDVVFTEYTALAGNTEIVRRLLSPLAAQMIQAKARQIGKPLLEQSIDLSQERYVLYVPAHVPDVGYGVLVFVPPWNDALLPLGWDAALDAAGIIFVSAARSGNGESPLARREPLALLAVQNVLSRYRVNLSRLYVGGFSGGSRIAMRLALAYPDVFHGALLNAGSDPLGAGESPLPPSDLFRRFQESTRIVFVTGDKDALHLAMDLASVKSMRHWCVNDFDARITPFVGHSIVSGAALAEALRSLDSRAPPNPGALAACQATIGAAMAAALANVESLMSRSKTAPARRALLALDAQYGGLAATQTVDLARQCACVN